MLTQEKSAFTTLILNFQRNITSRIKKPASIPNNMKQVSVAPKQPRIHTVYSLSNIFSFFSGITGSIILAWTGFIIWNDITVWNKNITLILFGSRSGEVISLGIGMRLIFYLILGLALYIPIFVFLRKRQVGHVEYDSSATEQNHRSILRRLNFFGNKKSIDANQNSILRQPKKLHIKKKTPLK